MLFFCRNNCNSRHMKACSSQVMEVVSDANFRKKSRGQKKCAVFLLRHIFRVVARLTGACTLVIKSFFRLGFWVVFCCRQKFCVAQHFGETNSEINGDTYIFPVSVSALKMSIKLFP